MKERPRWQGDERLGADGDRPRHARPRRRLARRQRGDPRPAPGRGDDRLRPAHGGRPVARPRGRLDRLDPAAGAAAAADSATPPASSTPATAPGRRSSASAYADRIVARLGQHIENLESASLGRVVLSPADIAALDVNLEHGDIYAGACTLDQNLLWRPLPQTPGHETPVDRLYHIGASTHPGPGLGAGSGYLVAKKLTQAGRSTAASSSRLMP